MTDFVHRLSAALADRYTINRELGAGGMATVFLAHDIKHDRDVAIKVLHPDLGAALGGERFLSEIRTTARLQHPHVLPLLDSGDAGGLLYYVMPVVTGETLRARLDRERQLPIADAVRIAREVASALDYAHRQGVIHRDIKPENILLHDDSALVADFGIALAVQTAGGQRMTQTGLSLGTPQYMSPEQAMGERVIDARSDVYALGAMTYEMLTGEAPFTGTSVQAIVARVLSEEPRGLSIQRKSISPDIEDAVLRALEKLPADRFGSAAEFSDALATTSGNTRGVAVATSAAVQRSRRVVLVTGSVAVAMTALAAWGWLKPQPSPTVVRYSVPLDSVPETRDALGELALSPDGEYQMHSVGLNGQLLLRKRNALHFHSIPGTDGGRVPFFSPDGTQIGYVVGNALMTAPLTGGNPVELTNRLVSNLQTPTWEHDGYVYGIRDRDSESLGIWRMRAEKGAAMEEVTTVNSSAGEQAHYWPELLPNGKSLLFTVQYRDSALAIAISSIKSGSHQVLFKAVRVRYSMSGHLLYSTVDGKMYSLPFDARSLKVTGTPTQISDRLRNPLLGPVDFDVSATGTLAFVTDDRTSQRELTWVSRDGQNVVLDSAWRGEFSHPSLSNDGQRLAVAMSSVNGSDIWVRNMTTGQKSKLTLDTKGNQSPVWSPDGRSITFISGASNTGVVYSKRVDSGDREQRLWQSEDMISECVWTPNAEWLVVRTNTGTVGAGDIRGIRPSLDTSHTTIIGTEFSEYSPTFSPDGKWMAYVSAASGLYEVYVSPFPNAASAKWQVSTRTGSSPRWSGRGDELFYLDGESNMVSVQVSTSPTFSVGKSTVLFNASSFVAVSSSRRNYDVAPDGQHFVMIRRAKTSAPAQLVIVENWFEELKRGEKTP